MTEDDPIVKLDPLDLSDRNIPACGTLPVYMLREGDMLWHDETRWFHRCTYEGSVPGIVRGPDEHKVAVDPAAAEAWNDRARAKKLGRL